LRTGYPGLITHEGSDHNAQPDRCSKVARRHGLPARKDELIARAKDNGASGEVMDALQKLPDREYDGPSGVQKEIF
jgi:hypothetical protein